MYWYEFLGWIIGTIVVFFSIAFFITNIVERETRALILSMVFLIPFCAIELLILLKLHFNRPFVLIAEGVFFLLLGVFLFSPIGKSEGLRIVGKQERIDERDVIFSRVHYREGSAPYQDYYSRHPELVEIDKKIRQLPTLGSFGPKSYHPLNSTIATACFDILRKANFLVDGPVNPNAEEVDAAAMSRRLKGMAKYYGAKLVGITKLNPAYVYSHVGRQAEHYGQEVRLNHKFAVVFAVEMDYFMVKQAPGVPVITETAAQYVEAAKIAVLLAQYIRSLGYPARAHIDANYRVVLPPIAQDAGLGEVSRIGILISLELGPRIRLGGVTTDMPLIPDKPVVYGILDFCERCRKCADNCPARAISRGEMAVVRGVRKWVVNQEACYAYWRKVGTDCAICMSVCPYSKPRTFIHNVTRFAVSQSPIARQLAIWSDDLFYGRRPRSRKLPQWMKG